MTRKPDLPTLYQKRLDATAEKLNNALDRLARGTPVHPALRDRPYRLTIAVLAREAGVGRNAIYTNHRGILDELARIRQSRAAPDRRAGADQERVEQRAIIEDLQHRLRRLATENTGLLKRAVEAEERAARADRRSAQLTREIDAMRRPIAFRRPDP